MLSPERDPAQRAPIDLKRRGGGFYRLGSRRARAACTLCRWRKVRCDAEQGQRCSNCTFEDVQCVLVQKQRRKKTSSEGSPLVTKNLARENLDCATTRSTVANRPESEESQQQVSPLSNGTQPSTAQKVQTEVFHASKDIANALGQRTTTFDWQAAVDQSLPPPISPNPSIGLSNAGMTFSDTERSLPQLLVPPFVTAIPSHLAREDIEYLQRKGALTIPEQELRDELLRCYIEFIHPCLPVIDLQAFQASLENPSNNGVVSFSLFQAVMFAGSAWVDIKLLRRLGYLTRKAARKAFYLRARVLYDADYEQDRLCIVQTLLLLSLWWEGPNELKDGWHWSGLALSVAKTIGLNRDANSDSLNPNMRRLRRQLWWCCLMRDTIASFGLNRVPRLRDCDFNVAMLTLADFEIYEPASPETQWAVPKDVGTQKQLASICIGMAKICYVLGKVLQVAYDENSAGHIGTLYSNQDLDAADTMPAPNKTHMEIQRLRSCEEELRKWKEEMPEDALHQSPIPNFSLLHEQACLLQRAMLSMLYYTAILSLHKPRILMSSSVHVMEQIAVSNGPYASRRMIRYASTMTNKIVMDLYQADLMRLLPATGISCLIPVSISHVLDMRSFDENTRREGFQRLEECKQALRELADAHIAAQWAVNFLTFVASQNNHTSVSHTRVSGMMSGEIKWNFQSQSQSAVGAQNLTPPSEGNHSLSNEMFGVFDLATPGPLHTQNAVTVSLDKQLSNFANPTDDFSDTIYFPEMWLNLAGASDTVLDMDWVDHSGLLPDPNSTNPQC